MDRQLSNLQIASLLFTQPREAFARLKENPRFALPLWAALIGTAATVLWYYSAVNMEWLQEQMIPPDAPAASQPPPAMPRGVLIWVSLLAGVVGLLVIRGVEAVYFLLAGYLTNVRYRFRQWFAFSWWASSPQLLALIPSLLLLMFGDVQTMDMSELQPLSLNELLFHRTINEPGFSLFTTLTLLHIASWALTIVGVRVWSGRSLAYSVIYAMLPAVLIYGTWAAVSLA